MNDLNTALAEGILFTDMYQLTMAQLYFRMGLHERRAQFDHFFRRYPNYGDHQAGYCINAGLEWVLRWMEGAHFGEAEIAYLRGQTGRAGSRLFDDDFLDWLAENGNFSGISLSAVPEGRVVHPHVPLTIVEGPLAMAQILETALLNFLNYQTLIATKAARISLSGRGQPFLEFGMRRGHERGVNAGARAALIGGAGYTSNVGISAVLGYPPQGTHAHSMIQTFMALGEGELGAFRAYAEVYPDDCLLLVDTINTLQSGVPNAIKVFEELRSKGHKPVGIRLDSGDLAYLSIQAAKMLDSAGFDETIIVLSNSLDEMTIWQILTQIEQEAGSYGVDPAGVLNRLVYGVGTRLITSQGDSALGGVYKLVALQDSGKWVPAIKISENPIKTPNPGRKKAYRIYETSGRASADLLALEEEGDPAGMESITLHHPTDYSTYRVMQQSDISHIEPLHVEILRDGELVYDLPTIEDMRQQRQADLAKLDSGVKRLIYPHIYHVSLTNKLWQLKQDLINEARRS